MLVVLEALEVRDGIEWVRDLQRSLNNFEQGDVNVEDLGRFSAREIGQMLHDSAVRIAKSCWEAEVQACSKLNVLQSLLVSGCKLKCVNVKSKRVQRIVAKFRGGMAELRKETGRWFGLKREKRVCMQCMQQEVENEEHFLLQCGNVAEEKEAIER